MLQLPQSCIDKIDHNVQQLIYQSLENVTFDQNSCQRAQIFHDTASTLYRYRNSFSSGKKRKHSIDCPERLMGPKFEPRLF